MGEWVEPSQNLNNPPPSSSKGATNTISYYKQHGHVGAKKHFKSLPFLQDKICRNTSKMSKCRIGEIFKI